ncbi:hypothetical protein Tco_0146045 [Tanacetum coccineum]
MQQPMPDPKDIIDPTTAMNMALVLMSKAFKLNYSKPTNNNQRNSLNPRNRQIAQPGINLGQDRQMQMVRGNGGNQFRQYVRQNVGNQNGYNAVQTIRNQVVQNAVQNLGWNVVAAHGLRVMQFGNNGQTKKKEKRDAAFLQTQLLIAQKEKEGIQLQAKEFDFMAAVGDLEEITELEDDKGKSKDTPCVLDTINPLSQKLENENVELEFQVLNYAKENAHLKTTYKNLCDSISVTQTQTKTIIDSLQNKLHDTIYDNAKLRAQLFDKVSEQKDITKGTSANTKFANQSTSGIKLYSVTLFPKSKIIPKVVEMNDLSNPLTFNLVPTTTESKVVTNDKVITPGMFRINSFKTFRKDK